MFVKLDAEEVLYSSHYITRSLKVAMETLSEKVVIGNV